MRVVYGLLSTLPCLLFSAIRGMNAARKVVGFESKLRLTLWLTWTASAEGIKQLAAESREREEVGWGWGWSFHWERACRNGVGGFVKVKVKSGAPSTIDKQKFRESWWKFQILKNGTELCNLGISSLKICVDIVFTKKGHVTSAFAFIYVEIMPF